MTQIRYNNKSYCVSSSNNAEDINYKDSNVKLELDKLISDLDTRTAVTDLLVEADKGVSSRRLVVCNQSTLNTPRSDGLTTFNSGLAIIMSSGTNYATILYIPSGTNNIFIKSKNDGQWTSWFNYKELIGALTLSDIINNLSSTSTSSALSAYQGKLLNDKIEDLNDKIEDRTGTTVHTDKVSLNNSSFFQINNASLVEFGGWVHIRISGEMLKNVESGGTFVLAYVNQNYVDTYTRPVNIGCAMDSTATPSLQAVFYGSSTTTDYARQIRVRVISKINAGDHVWASIYYKLGTVTS